MSFGQVRSQLFENALKFWFVTWWGFGEKMRKNKMARKCSKILVSCIWRHMINLLRRPFALKFWTPVVLLCLIIFFFIFRSILSARRKRWIKNCFYSKQCFCFFAFACYWVRMEMKKKLEEEERFLARIAHILPAYTVT